MDMMDIDDYFDGGRSEMDESMSTTTSTTKKGVKNKRSCRPVTIKQIKNAANQGESTFVIDDQELTDLTIVGVVRSITKQENHASYMMEDGTGAIDVRLWTPDIPVHDSAVDEIVPDMYVRVFGRLSYFREFVQVTSYTIRPINDFNEVTYHFLDVIYTHLVVNNQDMVNNMDKVHVEDDTIKNEFELVKTAIYENTMSVNGAYIYAVFNHCKSKMTDDRVMEVIQTLEAAGELFYTKNDQHLKLVSDI